MFSLFQDSLDSVIPELDEAPVISGHDQGSVIARLDRGSVFPRFNISIYKSEIPAENINDFSE